MQPSIAALKSGCGQNRDIHTYLSESKMPKRAHVSFLLAISLLFIGCADTPSYTPASVQPQSIDVTAYAPKVESFAVILDISSSMTEDYQGRPRIHIAQDLLASFNDTVPAADFNAGLVTFGMGTGRCIGQGLATAAYGLSRYQTADFASALAAVECAGGTTPMSDGIDATTQLLEAESGHVAVILVSDFQWVNASSVESAVSELRSQHGEKLCLHTVKVGDNVTGNPLIARLNAVAGCDSAVSADAIGSADAMASYVTEVLLAPIEITEVIPPSIQYEKHTVSATALFDFDKAGLKEQGKAELHKLDEYIKSKGVTVVDLDIIGHTDSVGSEEYNQALSKKRASAVKAYMVSEGIDASIIDVIGKGESEPTASNDTAEGRAQNRRVEIHVGTSRPVN
jgi:OOP family OmpA-OmpF porin